MRYLIPTPVKTTVRGGQVFIETVEQDTLIGLVDPAPYAGAVHAYVRYVAGPGPSFATISGSPFKTEEEAVDGLVSAWFDTLIPVHLGN